MDALAELEASIAELNSRCMSWKWAPDNPLEATEKEILGVLARAIKLYADGPPVQRDELRQMLSRYPGVKQYLKVFVTGEIRKLHTVVLPDQLYSALIAISIDDDNFGDYRDLLTMLGNLWLSAA